MRFDIIVVGSATVDVFAHTDREKYKIIETENLKRVCYPLGAKIIIKELNFFTGGSGTNTSVAFSRMGFKTGFLGKIGSDINGEIILKELARESVEFLGPIPSISEKIKLNEKTKDKSNKYSGYSVILDSVNEDRTIFTYKGSNDSLSVKDFNLRDLDSKWFYFGSMMNESFKTQEKIAVYAKKNNKFIIYNPSLYVAKQGYRKLRKIIKNTEVLIFNKEESQALLKTDSENIFELLEKIHSLGPKIVVITDGSNGVSCFDSYEKMFYFAKPRSVKIVETTGAGDAFAAGFSAGLMWGKNIETAIKFGMLNAESVITHLGAKNRLLGPEIIRLAEKDNREIIKKIHFKLKIS